MAAFGILGLVFGCASAPATPAAAAAESPSCVATRALANAPDSITIALPYDVTAAHVPDARNEAERLVFAQLYEGLVRVDCTGAVRPGLARSWNTDETRRRWTFVLRDSARFWTSDAVRSADVVAAWRATGQSSSPDAALAARLADATTITDERTLVVTLDDSTPNVLAEGTLAIYRPRPASSWPEGTGRYRLPEAASELLELIPADRDAGPRVRVRTIRDADARDQLDAGVELLLTNDPRVVSYAAARADVISLPLPWNRVYVLAMTRDATIRVSPAMSEELARDVVRAEAGVPEPPFWWSDSTGCQRSTVTATMPAATAPRIVYRRDDRVAQQLAERLVAIAGMSSVAGGARGTRIVATGLAPVDFAAALRTGSDLAYVLDVGRRPASRCDAMTALVTTAPWLATPEGRRGLVPLVETRDRVIVRRERISLVMDRDGTLRIVGASGDR